MSDMLQTSEGFGRTTVLLTYKGNSECINRTVKRINGKDDWWYDYKRITNTLRF